MSENNRFHIGFGLGLLTGAFLMVFSVAILAPDPLSSQKQAILHGAAHYNPQTGVFTWNDEEKK